PLAAAQPEPDRKAVADDGGEADGGQEPRTAAVREAEVEGQDGRAGALEGVEREEHRADALDEGAAHVGRADLAAAGAPAIDPQGAGDEDPEGDRSAQIADHDGAGEPGGARGHATPSGARATWKNRRRGSRAEVRRRPVGRLSRKARP